MKVKWLAALTEYRKQREYSVHSGAASSMCVRSIEPQRTVENSVRDRIKYSIIEADKPAYRY